MRKVVLDTHILLWWLGSSDLLSSAQREFLRRADREGEIAISAITLWEVAKLVSVGRISLPVRLDRWLADLENHPQLSVCPLHDGVINLSVTLENFHRDPADQIIVATALYLGYPLMTLDRRIREWGQVATL